MVYKNTNKSFVFVHGIQAQQQSDRQSRTVSIDGENTKVHEILSKSQAVHDTRTSGIHT